MHYYVRTQTARFRIALLFFLHCIGESKRDSFRSVLTELKRGGMPFDDFCTQLGQKRADIIGIFADILIQRQKPSTLDHSMKENTIKDTECM